MQKAPASGELTATGEEGGRGKRVVWTHTSSGVTQLELCLSLLKLKWLNKMRNVQVPSSSGSRSRKASKMTETDWDEGLSWRDRQDLKRRGRKRTTHFCYPSSCVSTGTSFPGWGSKKVPPGPAVGHGERLPTDMFTRDTCSLRTPSSAHWLFISFCPTVRFREINEGGPNMYDQGD